VFGVFALFRMTQSSTRTTAEQTAVITLPGGTHTAGQLYNAASEGHSDGGNDEDEA
jgi:hypothetical protein